MYGELVVSGTTMRYASVGLSVKRTGRSFGGRETSRGVSISSRNEMRFDERLRRDAAELFAPAP